ncbi:helix-turn-helix domain-containing protein [Rhodocytophaga rosea]|uniref:Helix-turn-helix domain-containing protein n=1 Tax=Rhodocytophaga rosea TaxID=2704465 RepID=A0A6C0GHG7_9BACT|nr:helix-turn-helix domain-containing protein [Rhodocytophaga rosea]QHT67399.1 helix-turn-helix domain-containing protein [Rhodocytophaga rosea]
MILNTPIQPSVYIIISREDLRQLLADTVFEELQKFTPQLQVALSEDKKQYLTRKETAALLQISLVTLHNWNKTEKLVPEKIGRRSLYARKTIEQVLSGSKS